MKDQITLLDKPTENTVIFGDAVRGLQLMPDECVDTCITSPPYFNLRDYGKDGQIGLEDSADEYIEKLVMVFREVRRVLKPDGTLWVNIADSYAGSGKGRLKSGEAIESTFGKINSGSRGTLEGILKKTDANGCKPKDLIGIPWMLAFALRADGWYLRQDIIWHKPNPMPESVRDRCTKSHEYIFLLSKNPRYYFDSKAIQEPANEKWASRYKSAFNCGKKERLGCGRKNAASNTGGLKTYTGFRNKRDVWTVAKPSYRGAHFATFPDALITPCVLAGSKVGGVVLDPFLGSGTTLMVANKHGRNGIGIELNDEYEQLIKDRIGEYERITAQEAQ